MSASTTTTSTAANLIRRRIMDAAPLTVVGRPGAGSPVADRGPKAAVRAGRHANARLSASPHGQVMGLSRSRHGPPMAQAFAPA
ncbi:hypothetical protein GCM10010327_51510 [Streptomyces nitrosporeus]|nr:hypothetical protein GCM10010327_51510 [Streptomyces nitrosporeus]